MLEFDFDRFSGRKYAAIPPGETIKELMDLSLSQARDLLKGTRMLAEPTALRLNEVVGMHPGFWLGMENSFLNDLKKVHREQAILKDRNPVRKMLRYGWFRVQDHFDSNQSQAVSYGIPLKPAKQV